MIVDGRGTKEKGKGCEDERLLRRKPARATIPDSQAAHSPIVALAKLLFDRGGAALGSTQQGAASKLKIPLLLAPAAHHSTHDALM